VNGISASDDVNIIVKKGIPDPTECQPDQCRDVSTGLCRAIGPNEHKSPTDGSCQPNPVTGGKTTIMAFADGDAVNSNSDKVLEAVFKEPEADCYIAAGDFGYKNKMKEMVARFEKYFKTPQLMDKLFPNEGNHDGPESQNAEQRKIFMDWYGRGLEQKNWLLGRQVGRVYLIGLNTQDTSVEQETGEQRKWAEQEFIVADKLRSEGKIDWIMTVAHKPFFTLKTSHSEYTAVRKIYDPLFRKYKVILMIQGHNHNYQASYPMIVDFSTDANGLGKQLFTYATDGVTFDASKEIGTIYNITGHFGHEWNAINTSGEAVKNFMNFRHSGLFGFTKIVAEIKDGKPHLTVSEISTDSKVNFEYYVTQ
jgi:predicted phosphodiesterase